MVPYQYNKPQIDLLYKLIAESNPGVVYPIIPENAKIGKPEAIAVMPGTIANTRIPISGQGPYMASVRVNYRRINLTELFKGVTISFDTWTGSNYLSGVTLREYLNKAYGLALTATEIPDGAVWVGGRNALNIAASSLCYTGSVSWIWTNGRREIGAVLTKPDVDGRLFPGGNVFGGSRKPQGEYVCYDLDFDSVKVTSFVNILPASWPSWVSAASWAAPLFNFLQTKVSPLFDISKPHTEVGGIEGAPGVHIALPSALVPEANSAKYNRAVVLTALPGSWWQGKIIFHYNA